MQKRKLKAYLSALRASIDTVEDEDLKIKLAQRLLLVKRQLAEIARFGDSETSAAGGGV